MVADPGGLDGREHALYAAYLSAAAFASAGSGLHHKICHVLGGKYNLPHAQTHAIVLPYVLAFNGPAAPDAERRIAAAFGTATALDGLQALRQQLRAPRALRGLRLRRGLDRRGGRRDPAVGPPVQPAPGHRRGPPRAAARSLGGRRPPELFSQTPLPPPRARKPVFPSSFSRSFLAPSLLNPKTAGACFGSRGLPNTAKSDHSERVRVSRLSVYLLTVTALATSSRPPSFGILDFDLFRTDFPRGGISHAPQAHIALGCALTGGLAFPVAAPPGTALADKAPGWQAAILCSSASRRVTGKPLPTTAGL